MPAWSPILPALVFPFASGALSRLEAKTLALANHPAQAGTEHNAPALSPGQTDPAAQHPIQTLSPSPATHGTGRGASLTVAGGRAWLALCLTG